MKNCSICERRRFLFQATTGSAAFFTVPGAFAEELLRVTAPQGEGPFYPDRLPLDTDNDLIVINDSITPAVGEVSHLTGCLLYTSASPRDS